MKKAADVLQKLGVLGGTVATGMFGYLKCLNGRKVESVQEMKDLIDISVRKRIRSAISGLGRPASLRVHWGDLRLCRERLTFSYVSGACGFRFLETI